jgi:hypothetical protein
MLCGRVLGRLIGPLPANDPARRAQAGIRPTFAAFRPADLSAPAVHLKGGEHFRCSTCGGAVIMDELEFFTTYDDDLDDESEDVPDRPRRGRPPKPWRRVPTGPDWLADLGIAG